MHPIRGRFQPPPPNPVSLFYRRKVALALLEALGGELKRTDFQKHLFLYTRDDPDPPYDFVPYQYGSYSFSAEADRTPMVRAGLLHDGEAWSKKTRTSYVGALRAPDLDRLRRHVRRHGALRGEALVRTVYAAYPYYATRSRIAGDLLSSQEMAAVEAARPAHQGGVLFTLGYEGRSVESYLDQLLRNGVTVLCDVRRNPVSRKYGFSKRTLRACVEKLGMRYVHTPELGIASGKRQAADSADDYARLFDEYAREVLPHRGEELEQIAALVGVGERVALTCFEACHGDCHRSRVADAVAALPGWGACVLHL